MTESPEPTAAARTGRRPAREMLVDLACVAVCAVAAVAIGGEAEQDGRLTGTALFWVLLLAAAGWAALW